MAVFNNLIILCDHLINHWLEENLSTLLNRDILYPMKAPTTSPKDTNPIYST